jgi:hypothetical protein
MLIESDHLRIHASANIRLLRAGTQRKSERDKPPHSGRGFTGLFFAIASTPFNSPHRS